MSQLKVNTTDGYIFLPSYTYQADSFKTGLAYNTTSLEIQLVVGTGNFYRYTVGSNITNGTAPTGSNQIGFTLINPTGWFVRLQLHNSVYSSLSESSGNNNGILSISASGFGPVSREINFVDSTVSINGADVRSSVGLSSANLDTQLTPLSAGGSGLTSIPWNASWDAEVQSEVQDAIEANHLDHLFAAAYNPASKPGSATALLNVMVENDGGVPRYTTNALEQGPSGSGGGGANAQTIWEYDDRTLTTDEINRTNTTMYSRHISSGYDYYGGTILDEWQISKVNISSSATTTATQSGNPIYGSLEKAWANRLTLDYA